MSTLYALDPGTLQSALVVLQRGGLFGINVLEAKTLLNGVLLGELARAPTGATFVCEQITAMGLPIGNETMRTIWWSGRFYEAWPAASSRYEVSRMAVKNHLCGNSRAKDAHIRQVLMDRFGGSAAKGTKRLPGPLHGLSGHTFAALAVGVTWLDQHPQSLPAPAQAAREASYDSYPLLAPWRAPR